MLKYYHSWNYRFYVINNCLMDLSTFQFWNCPLSIMGISIWNFEVSQYGVKSDCKDEPFLPSFILYLWQRLITYATRRVRVKRLLSIKVIKTILSFHKQLIEKLDECVESVVLKLNKIYTSTKFRWNWTLSLLLSCNRFWDNKM